MTTRERSADNADAADRPEPHQAAASPTPTDASSTHPTPQMELETAELKARTAELAERILIAAIRHKLREIFPHAGWLEWP